MKPYSDQARIKIAKLAAEMLAGSVEFIIGARQIAGLRFDADLEWDSDILPFVGIDSETDALPLDGIRALWRPDALTKLQPEIDRAKSWAKEFGAKHCENLVKRFGSP